MLLDTLKLGYNTALFLIQLLNCSLSVLCVWSEGNYGYLFWVRILVVVHRHVAMVPFERQADTLACVKEMKAFLRTMMRKLQWTCSQMQNLLQKTWVKLHLCKNMMQVSKISVLCAVESVFVVWENATVCTCICVTSAPYICFQSEQAKRDSGCCAATR